MDEELDDSHAPEAIAIKRHEVDETTNPNISTTDSIVLYNGPRVLKRASHFVIIDRSTREKHHHAIKIETLRQTKGATYLDDEHSIQIEDGNEDEISRLATFLCAIRNMPDAPGDYLIVPIGSDKQKRQAILEVANAITVSDKVDAIADLLIQIKGNPEVLQSIAKRIAEDPQASKEATAALNLARFSAAVERLEELIRSNAKESQFQAHLSEHPWLFGSEYSELLDRRKWTRDEQQDFMVRRTADEYIEMIEIKTPLIGKSLFIYDNSHKTFYPSTELSAVIGQVTHYLEKLDGERNVIKAELGVDVSKICAKIIIGYVEDKAQLTALRRLNGHLHRIEILTFNQLLKIARQVLRYQEQILSSKLK